MKRAELEAMNKQLLDALQDLVAWFGDDKSQWDGWEGVDEVLPRANKVIARATGEER